MVLFPRVLFSRHRFLDTSSLLVAQTAPVAEKLKAVAAIHGAAGVFAVAGYRMGERALTDLKFPRGSFALEVIHRTPSEVQWSCIADGLQAATGASAGKLNLRLVESPAGAVTTEVTNRRTGQRLVFELQPEFVRRFLNLPIDQPPAAGKEVMDARERNFPAFPLNSGGREKMGGTVVRLWCGVSLQTAYLSNKV